MKTIILLGAQRRVGKDTFAKLLEENIRLVSGESPRILSFAESLREECSAAFNEYTGFQGYEEVDFFTEDPALKEKVVRPLLIAWGQARRHQDPDYWVRDLIYRTKEAQDGVVPRVFIVPDWRFVNEYQRLVDEPDFKVIPVCLTRRAACDPTPDEIINAPLCQKLAQFVVENNGSREELGDEAALLVGYINREFLSK